MSSHPLSRTLSRPSSHLMRGFTGLEPVVILGIIAILIGLLLPAQQKERELANRTGASGDATKLANVAKSFETTHGRSAVDINEIIADCTAQARCSLPTSLRDGVDHGYLYYFNSGARVIEAWPARPGLTGSVTLFVNGSPRAGDANRTVSLGATNVKLVNGKGSQPTPSAVDDGTSNTVMVAELMEQEGIHFLRNPGLSQQVREGGFSDPFATLQSIDANGDAAISIGELLAVVREQMGITFEDVIISSYQLGAGGERLDWKVSLNSLPNLESVSHLSYDHLRQATDLLTRTDVSNLPTSEQRAYATFITVNSATIDNAFSLDIAGDNAGALAQLRKLGNNVTNNVGRFVTRDHAQELGEIALATSAP